MSRRNIPNEFDKRRRSREMSPPEAMNRNTTDGPEQSLRRRVCIVAPVHVWDDVRVFHKQAATLAAAGYDVVLLAQARGRHVAQGVRVTGVWAPRTPQLLRFLSLPLVLVQALVQRADVYHLHNPDTLPLCIVLKVLGRRVIYDTHEDFSQRIAIREWIPRALRYPVSRSIVRTERVVAKLVDRTIATQARVAARLGEKAAVIANPPRSDVARLQQASAKSAAAVRPPDDGLRAVYVGLVSKARGLFDMIDATERVNEERPMRLRIIGPATPRQIKKARARPGWRHVEYLGRMPQKDAFAYIAESDVGLAVLHDVADFSHADPNKLYEYMVFGKPFIASNFPQWRARLQGIDGGWFVSPGSVEEMTAALKAAMDPEVRRKKGEAGAAFIRTYNWEKESAKLIDIYREILS